MRRLSRISLISYSYIVLAVLVTYFVPLGEDVKSLIAQPALVLIPYLVGKPLFFLARGLLSIKETNDFVVDALIYWSLGLLFMVSLEAALYVSYIFTLNSFIIVLLIIGFSSIFIKERADFSNLKHLEIGIVAVYGVLFALFVTHFWPYPYANDNDHIRHAFYTTRIVLQNRPLLFYQAYLPTMHTIYAVMMKLFSVDPYKEPLLLLWSSRFILYPVYAIGMFLLTYRVSKDKLLAFIAALIGSSLLNWADGSFFPHHTSPKNFIGIQIIYGLYAALSLRPTDEKENILPSLFGLGALLLLVYIPLSFTGENGKVGYEIGLILPILFLLILGLPRIIHLGQRNLFLSLAIVISGFVFMAKAQGLQVGAILLAFLFFTWLLSELSLNKARITAVAFAAITLAVFVLFYFKIVPYPTLPFLRPNDVQISVFGMAAIMRNLSSMYPPFLVFLFTAGSLFAIFSRDEDDKRFLVPVIMASITMLAYFAPFYMFYRTIVAAHPFIILIIGFAIFKLLGIRLANPKEAAFLPLLFITVFASITVYLNDIKVFPDTIAMLDQKNRQVFEIGRYIKENVDKGAIAIQYESYQQTASYYGGVEPVYLWVDSQKKSSYVTDIYYAETSEESYEKVKTLMKNNEHVVRQFDKDGKETKRFYKQPTETILLVDDPLLWHIDLAKLNKFFDPRYFDFLFMTKNKGGDRFFIFRVKSELSSEGLNNLVENASFEEGWDSSKSSPVAWKRVWDERWAVELDLTAKSDGEYSLKMETSVTKPQTWSGLKSEDSPVEGGKAYLFSAKMKTQNAASTYISVDYYDKAIGKWITIGVLNRPEVTHDWKTFSKFIDIPPNISSVVINVGAGWAVDEAKGKAISWFDNLELIGPLRIVPPKGR